VQVPATGPNVAVTTGRAFVDAESAADAPPVVAETAQFTRLVVPFVIPTFIVRTDPGSTLKP